MGVAGEALELRQVEQAARARIAVLTRVSMLGPNPQHAVCAVKVTAGGCEHRGRTPQQHMLGLGRQELVPEQRGERRYRLLMRAGSLSSQSDGVVHGGGIRGGFLQRGCQLGCALGLCTVPSWKAQPPNAIGRRLQQAYLSILPVSMVGTGGGQVVGKWWAYIC